MNELKNNNKVFMRHQDITNEAIAEVCTALLARAKKLFNTIVDQDDQISGDADMVQPDYAYSLLRRLKLFGVEGVICEGELSDVEFEEIDALEQLESICFYDHHGLVKTIALAASGRLTLAIAQGFDLFDIHLSPHNLESRGRLISLEELSCLANVSLASVRNAVSLENESLKPIKSNGVTCIDAKCALAWLEKRNEFKPTRYGGSDMLGIGQISVPVASDGSIFDYSCALKRGGFKVGEKGNEQNFESYDEALKYLSDMKLAKWRRPNKSGNYGIVSAMRWKDYPVDEILKC